MLLTGEEWLCHKSKLGCESDVALQDGVQKQGFGWICSPFVCLVHWMSMESANTNLSKAHQEEPSKFPKGDINWKQRGSSMPINLQKGQTINLDKDQYDLSMITIGLGWAIKKKSGGFLSGLRGGGQADCDLDAIAFLLDKNSKVRNLGREKLVGSDVIFFGNLKHPDGNIYHTGDNLVGGEGSDDDEQIVVKLNSMNQAYDRILFLVSIYQGIKKRQHFGMVEKAFIRAAVSFQDDRHPHTEESKPVKEED